MDPFDRAAEQIERDYDQGVITSDEYQEVIRDLRADAREYAQECADKAYDDAMGGW
jgi:hypothetical protein